MAVLSRRPTAQFYLRDLAVFKVMFSAIVTAMNRGETGSSSRRSRPMVAPRKKKRKEGC